MRVWLVICGIVVLLFFSVISQYTFSGKSAKRVVALTFDDGPDPVFSEKILNVLAEENITATFFVKGESAESYPEIVMREVGGGNEVGMHSYSHRIFFFLTRTELEKEVVGTSALLEEETGQRITLFRPPYGFLGPIETWYVKTHGLKIVDWSIDSKDYVLLDKEAIVKRVVSKVYPGAIIIVHDGGGKTRQPTVDALPEIISGLREEGYSFVTVSELLK